MRDETGTYPRAWINRNEQFFTAFSRNRGVHCLNDHISDLAGGLAGDLDSALLKLVCLCRARLLPLR